MKTKYEKLSSLSDGVFRRLTGVKRATFVKMELILSDAHKIKKAKGGRPNRLAICDMLLMCLEYLREYRTYLHVGQSYGVSEASAYQSIRWVENILIKHPDFSLPGRKALLKSDMQYEVILIDATETPIERPKKNINVTTLEKRKDTRSKVSSL